MTEHATRATRLLAVSAAVVVSIVSCNGATGSGSTSDESDFPYEDSPLIQQYGDLYGAAQMGEHAADAYYDAMDREVEEAVAACMAEQGFDYVPQQSANYAYVDTEYTELGPMAWAEKYGFGLTTQQDNQPVAAPADPNDELLDAMSEAERQAWLAALWGEASEGEERTDGASGEATDRGCRGEAEEVVLATAGDENPWVSVLEDPQYSELLTQINEIGMGLENHPGIDALNAEWAECMSERGYPGLTSGADAQQLVSAEISLVDPNSDGMVDDVALADLTELQEFEIAVATTNITCLQEVDFEDRFTAIQFDLEQAFIDENRTELDALAAALQSASSDD